MSKKPELLVAVRDEVRAGIAGFQDRGWVAAQDVDGGQYLPHVAAFPFFSVADAGASFAERPGQVENGTYRVRVRSHVSNLRDSEAPVIGHPASGEVGAAAFQKTVHALLTNNLLAARISGVEEAAIEAEPPVGVVESEEDGWAAVFGDVIVRYRLTEGP